MKRSNCPTNLQKDPESSNIMYVSEFCKCILLFPIQSYTLTFKKFIPLTSRLNLSKSHPSPRARLSCKVDAFICSVMNLRAEHVALAQRKK